MPLSRHRKYKHPPLDIAIGSSGGLESTTATLKQHRLADLSGYANQ
jgi:hypothetical protein